ncbi:hypothetical protein HK101_008153 [Irineochytrium annulatum]|nr:hypothetical protein HK101_008153 [Irineochytrium annulatum]
MTPPSGLPAPLMMMGRPSSSSGGSTRSSQSVGERMSMFAGANNGGAAAAGLALPAGLNAAGRSSGSPQSGPSDTGYQSDDSARRRMGAGPKPDSPFSPEGTLVSRELVSSSQQALLNRNLIPSDPRFAKSGVPATQSPYVGAASLSRQMSLGHPLRGLPLASQLILACEHGDTGAVRGLLDMGVPPSCRDENNPSLMTPLITAARHGAMDIVRMLVERGAKMEDKDPEMGGTALFHAAICGHADTVRMLLSLGADARAPEWTGCTAVYAASFHGHVEVIVALLDRGASPDEPCASGTPLHAAIEGRQIGVIRVLLQRGAFIDAVDSVGRTPLWVSSQAGFLNAVECLLDHGADIDKPSGEGTRPLWIAIVNDHEEVAKRLVERGSDVNSPLPTFGPKDYGYTPLHGAAHRNHPRLAHALIERGAPLTCEDNTSHTPLHLAAMSDNAAVAEVLLWHDPATANRPGTLHRTPLFLAALWNSPRTASLLLSYGADPNLLSDPHSVRATPLRAAVQGSHPGMVELLLAHGADPNIRAADGSTCLHVAIANGSAACASLLIRHGADVDAQLTVGGETPLHLATRKRRKKHQQQLLAQQMMNLQMGDGANSAAAGMSDAQTLVRMLLDAGASVNMSEARAGMSPLHLASREGDVTTCVLLIDLGGANLEALTHAGYAPLAIASLNSRVKVVAELLSRGASARATSFDGTTALHAAVMAPGTAGGGAAGAGGVAGASGAVNPSEAIVGMLVAKGAEVDAVDMRGDTPLKVASRAGNLFAVRALIAAGASLDQLAWPDGAAR